MVESTSVPRHEQPVVKWAGWALVLVAALYFADSYYQKVTGPRPPAPGPAVVPASGYGPILQWDPVVRDAAGVPTGEMRPLPKGWHYCDGKDGIIDLGDSARRYVVRTDRDAPVPVGATAPAVKQPR